MGEEKMKCYQPEYDEKLWEKNDFYSWFLFTSKKLAQEVFPTLKILAYEVGDIENPEFIDHVYKKDPK